MKFGFSLSKLRIQLLFLKFSNSRGALTPPPTPMGLVCGGPLLPNLNFRKYFNRISEFKNMHTTFTFENSQKQWKHVNTRKRKLRFEITLHYNKLTCLLSNTTVP